MKLFMFWLVCTGWVCTAAEAQTRTPFDLIQAGDYGTLNKKFCGLHFEKNTAYQRIVAEIISNPLDPRDQLDPSNPFCFPPYSSPNPLCLPIPEQSRQLNCNVGLVIPFECNAAGCEGYFSERREKAVIQKEGILDDGNLVVHFYRYDFKKEEYAADDLVKYGHRPGK